MIFSREAKETVIYCMGLLFKANAMQKNGITQ